MIETVTIALWAHLFCGPWSEPEKVFGWLKAALYKSLPAWAFQPVIGCAMCHAVWAALAFEGWKIWHGAELGAGCLLVVFCSSFLADLLNDFREWRQNKINS